MRMFVKMVALFSVMILVIIAISYRTISQTADFGITTLSENRFATMGTAFEGNLNRYISLNDMALYDLLENPLFASSLYTVQCEDSTPAQVSAAQNTIWQIMQTSSIIESFYRVSVFTADGFYLSSRVDRKDAVISMSEEAQELIAAIPYLDTLNTTPHSRVMVGMHNDWFRISQDTPVVSCARCVTYDGKVIGYIEVSTLCSDLADYFLTDNVQV